MEDLDRREREERRERGEREERRDRKEREKSDREERRERGKEERGEKDEDGREGFPWTLPIECFLFDILEKFPPYGMHRVSLSLSLPRTQIHFPSLSPSSLLPCYPSFHVSIVLTVPFQHFHLLSIRLLLSRLTGQFLSIYFTFQIHHLFSSSLLSCQGKSSHESNW
jgi:hypothetical protein